MPRGHSLYDWCQENGEWGHQLLQEWTGLDESKNIIEMHILTYGSQKKVQWKCKEGHQWLSTIKNRTVNKSGCPYCSGNLVSNKNSLSAWCQTNGEWGQQIIQEWTGLDENNNPININEVAYGSNKKVQWKCKEGHTWSATIFSRTNCKAGCSYCAGKKVSNKNSLLAWCQANREYGKKLLSEWTGLDENKKPIDINEVTRASRKRVYWKCKEGHEWLTAIGSRTVDKCGCKICGYKTVSKKIRSKLLRIGENDLLTWCNKSGDLGKLLKEEWTGETEDGNIITMQDITYGNAMIKLKWKCSKGHVWLCIVRNRTYRKNCCPYCNPYGTSFPEQFIYHSLKQIFPNSISRGKYQGYEYDITIPELRLCIEYSGFIWHKDKLARDKEKEHLCKKHGVHFLQIYVHSGLKNKKGFEIDEIYTKEKIIYKQNNNKDLHKIQLILLIESILKHYAPEHTIAEINFAQAESDSYAIMLGNTTEEEENT